MVKVSVVIPVYNVEEFLKECLDCIVNQTLEDIEIICVNDGSTDKSLDILNFYAENDDRFTVISQENGGHAVATNRGMKLAEGEYLYLMDSDDMVELTALEETYNYAKEKEADFVIFQSLNYVMDEDRVYKTDIYSMEHIADFVGDSVFTYEDLGDMIFDIPVTPWSKLYNNQFIKDIGATFPEGLVFDDNIFFWDVLFNAKRIAFYRKHLFKRRWYSYSSTTAGDQRFLDSIDIHNLMVDRFEKYGLMDKYQDKVVNRKVNMAYNRFVDIKPEFEEMYFEKLHEDFENCIDDGFYEKYMEKSLDNRNKAIFDSCVDSKSAKEFKYEMAYWDSQVTRKRLENDIKNLKKDIENLKTERNGFYKTQNNLKNQVKNLEDENNNLKNDNLKLSNQLSEIKSSNSWKLVKPLKNMKTSSSNGSFKSVLFNVSHSVVSYNDLIKLNNFKIIDSSNKEVRINPNKLIVIYDEVNKINFTELVKSDDYYAFPASTLGRGKHKVCIKYGDTLSDEVELFIKDANNLFDFNVWLGTYNTKDTYGFDKFQIKSISSSDDWAEIGDRSIKVECDGDNYQALTTPKLDVNIGDFISAHVTVYNPQEDVTVRLFESSKDSYTDVIVNASDIPTRVNISKTTISKHIQLILISRKKQTFYADNFVITRN
ncbi:glycosyltransferase family 2 protein [Methanobrevibacter sp.]|uniref:glycosyltransferase family 2 protein n=1 Tax=Methanobrevibacter sp. TaxID=66852 RepID=UPI003868735B